MSRFPATYVTGFSLNTGPYENLHLNPATMQIILAIPDGHIYRAFSSISNPFTPIPVPVSDQENPTYIEAPSPGWLKSCVVYFRVCPLGSSGYGDGGGSGSGGNRVDAKCHFKKLVETNLFLKGCRSDWRSGPVDRRAHV